MGRRCLRFGDCLLSRRDNCSAAPALTRTQLIRGNNGLRQSTIDVPSHHLNKFLQRQLERFVCIKRGLLEFFGRIR